LVEKNNLINEINTRKQELTNRTATIVKKNEAIISLRNELRKLQEISPNVTRTRNILDRSGEQLDSKNDWKLFETKFNELNEDFFERLSKEFPKLTTKDRKLCAYIKIGLTSKEIAPLLGITKRSVELQRYRLRKKLKLDAGINFNEFLRLF
jgi:DNA-binding NarL/FixJ family response regulator